MVSVVAAMAPLTASHSSGGATPATAGLATAGSFQVDPSAPQEAA